jgi:hypothetical protein
VVALDRAPARPRAPPRVRRVRRVRRIIPGENLNLVAAEQICSWLEQASPANSLPIFTFDAGYEPIQLRQALADVNSGLLVRLRAGRCFYADPTFQPAMGRPRRHGAKFVCDDPTTWPTPPDSWTATDSEYGTVCLRAWANLHAVPQLHATRGTRRPRPVVRGTVMRLDVARLPRPTRVPTPLWFWWFGPRPPDLAEVWRADTARFSIEHTCRFFKQTLRWTTPKLCSPASADRGTWLLLLAAAAGCCCWLLLAYVHLRLARDAAVDLRLPWQAPLPAERRTPARVRRGFSHVLAP